jgi:hypothetical protein
MFPEQFVSEVLNPAFHGHFQPAEPQKAGGLNALANVFPIPDFVGTSIGYGMQLRINAVQRGDNPSTQ